jgi:hypothetical protein
MKAWVFKVNTKRGWEFEEYFHARTRGPYEMGNGGCQPSNEGVANPPATE